MAELARPYVSREAFICGPDPFLVVVRQALSEVGIGPGRVHTERFLSLAGDPFEAAPPADGGVAATLEVTLDGEKRVLAWPPGTRLLDILLDGGLNPPFSCRQGICGACTCQLTAGQVEMGHNEVLEQADFAEGYILACQALPLTETVSVTYP